MSRSSISIESHSLQITLGVSSRRIGLMWKIVGTLAGVIILFGLLVIGVVYQMTMNALRAQVDERALAVATMLSDAAAGPAIAKNTLELNTVVTKSALLEGVAYAFVQDAEGEILAQSPAALPADIKQPLSVDSRRRAQQREMTIRGKTIYETRVPILGGQVGTAHVGIWGEGVEQQIRDALLPLLEIILALIIIGAVLAVLLARGIVRPLLALTRVADRISLGDLDTPIGVDTHDEIGDLARSLGRMRASLKAAMTRLSQNRPGAAAMAEKKKNEVGSV
jgi:nitrogen fixation/metabolism regulation signal transduction histidine kinase